MNHIICKLVFLLCLCCYSGTGLVGAESLLSEIFIKRHSGKSYDSSKVVSHDQLIALIDSARWSPSSYNDQPWNFIICDKHLTPEAYLKALSTLKEANQKWVQNAPVLMVVVARTKQLYKGKFNVWAEYDTGAAVMSLSLQAADLGLMVHQLGGFDMDQIRQQFQIPPDFKPMTVIAVGYETEQPDPNEQPRERRPMGENFFDGEWGRPVE